MNTEVERWVIAKDRKPFKLGRAVKCNWSKTNWQLKSHNKLLEEKLKSYHKQKQQSIRLFELRKYELEKRFVDTKTGKTKTRDEAEKIEKIINNDGYLGTQREATRANTRETESGDSDQNRESRLLTCDGKTLSGDSQQALLPGRRIAACTNRGRSRRFSRKLSDGPGIRQAGDRKMSWWESVPYDSEGGPFLPELADGTRKQHLVVRSSRSYSEGEKTNVYLPARERKNGVHQMQIILSKDCAQKRHAAEGPSCEYNFNLEELFQQLQNCRYLRPAGYAMECMQ